MKQLTEESKTKQEAPINSKLESWIWKNIFDFPSNLKIYICYTIQITKLLKFGFGWALNLGLGQVCQCGIPF